MSPIAPTPAAPDISVVVIVYNDAERLPRAIRSVLDQSLRNVEVVVVDDASTDESALVADGFAESHPGRVRVVRLLSNSGGCSRPRNVGVQHSLGTYVMFLDSDDTLDRHACRNMLSAAEETGADLVSGLCMRMFVSGKGGERPWRGWLYRSRAVYGSIADRPELLYDTLSTNKCYRRDFLERHDLRFPEGYHYEDLLFSARAYLAAEKIAVIPHRVYNWHVIKHGENLSISNRRGDIQNVVDRLAIQRMIDEELARHGDPELKLHKDVKFIKYDLALYVGEYSLRDPDYQREFRRLLAAYTRTLDPRAVARCDRRHGIALFMIQQDDHQGLAAVSDHLGAKGRLTADLVQRDDRIYWTGRHLDTEEGRRIQDVTSLGLHLRPLADQPPAAAVTRFEVRGNQVELAGEMPNPLGRIPLGGPVAATLEFRARNSRGRSFRVNVPQVSNDGTRLRWSVSFSLARRLLPITPSDAIWDVKLRVRGGGEDLTSPLVMPEAGHQPHKLTVRPAFACFRPVSLRSYITKGSVNTRGGHLAFRLRVRGRLARAGGLTFRTIETAAPRKKVAAAAGLPGRWFRRRFAAPMIRRHLYNRVFTRLPIRRGTVVFESHLGKQYSDSPKYIYECLRETGVPIRAIWSYRDSPEGFPAEAELVKRGSLAYYRALARAEFWIDNQGFPADAHKRAETTYIQTWHGSAFKRMGFDQPDIKLARPSARTRLRRMVDRFDYFVVRSAHDEQTLMPGFELRAEPLRVGYPRNDGLVAGGDPVELDRLREELGLDDGRRVVLYAPTFRSDGKGKVRTFGLPFDADRFVREFGERYVLLVRAHYLNKAMVAATPCGSVRDVSHVHDVTSLLLVSDALVTDYSSVMFDYALLDRPMLFHAPDLEDYVRSRGSYFDLAEHAPGPVTREEEEFFAALHGLDGPDQYAGARRQFVERFGEYDTGVAAKSIVQQFFVPEAPRGW